MKTKKASKKTSVSLVLGSGGARGLAHIGVIKWLEEHNFEIKSISGCSIGALIGGVYAAGKLNQLEDWMRSLKRTDMATLLDITWSSGGIFKGDRIINTLIEFLEDIEIEDLPIPFTAVATDIATEKEVWLSKGSLFEAVRASVSLPLFFTPVKQGDSILIDGGMLNPVPIAPTFKDDNDITIAVNLGGAIKQQETNKTQNNSQDDEPSELRSTMQKFLKKIGIERNKPREKNWSMYEVADRAFDAMQSTIANIKIASYPPDLVIEIARNACGTMEFERSAEMIELGYKCAEKAFKNSQIKVS